MGEAKVGRAGGMLAIAREMKDPEMRKAATEFKKAQKASAETLTKELAGYAAKIATSAPA